MPGPVTFTLDVEDYTAAGVEPRALATTRRILEFLGERNVRATFFVVGEFAEAHTEIVKEIASGGHEVGLHSYRHTPLTDADPETFRREIGDARAFMEDLAGQPVLGFRAPTFSLVASSAWAADVLAELGFTYSSSVLPARSPLYGYPGRPRTPHRWPSGLWELPCPVADLGPITNPYLGGIYFRVLPWTAVRYGLGRAHPDEMLWRTCTLTTSTPASRSRNGLISDRGSRGCSGFTGAACTTGSSGSLRTATRLHLSASASPRLPRDLVVLLRTLALGPQDCELFCEHTRAFLETRELIGEVHADQQEEPDRDEEQRGWRVVDPEEMRHAVEQGRERGEHQDGQPHEHPQQCVLAAHLPTVQQPQQEERARQHDEQHEHVGASRQSDRGVLRGDRDHVYTLRDRRGRERCPTITTSRRR